MVSVIGIVFIALRTMPDFELEMLFPFVVKKTIDREAALTTFTSQKIVKNLVIPEFEIIDGFLISNLDMNAWSGSITSRTGKSARLYFLLNGLATKTNIEFEFHGTYRTLPGKLFLRFNLNKCVAGRYHMHCV